MSLDKRLFQGIDREQKDITWNLTHPEIYGHRIRVATPYEDKCLKGDVYFDDLICSIKGRIENEYKSDDLLSCIAGSIIKPYSGKHELMITGRDAKRYHKIWCRTPNQTRYDREFCGSFCYDVACGITEEYSKRPGDALLVKAASSTMFHPKGSFTSDLYHYDGWNCQLKSFFDERDKFLKVVLYIPEEYARHCKALKEVPILRRLPF